ATGIFAALSTCPPSLPCALLHSCAPFICICKLVGNAKWWPWSRSCANCCTRFSACSSTMLPLMAPSFARLSASPRRRRLPVLLNHPSLLIRKVLFFCLRFNRESKAVDENKAVIAAVNLSSLMTSFTQRYHDILYSLVGSRARRWRGAGQGYRSPSAESCSSRPGCGRRCGLGAPVPVPALY